MALLDRIARLVLARPGWIVTGVLIATLGFAWELRGLRLDVRVSDQVPRGHPYTRIDDRLAARLGAHHTAIVAIEARRGDVFTPAVLTKIRRLTEAVSSLPGVVPSSVLSLASARAKAIESDGEEVRVTPLLRVVPTDPEALRALRERVFAYPLYVGTLVTADARGAMIFADFRDDASVDRSAANLEAAAARERDADADVYVGGEPPLLAAVNEATRGIVGLVALALVVIGLVQYRAFRTAQAVVLPLVTASLSVVWAMGITSALGFELTPWTAVTAVLVLSVAAGHAVQILKRYYECYHEIGDSRAAVAASLRSVGPVMAIACGIAAAGFASLATFRVPAVRDFGLMAACGILSALVLELTFIPACRVLLRPPRFSEALRERSHPLLDPVLDLLVGAVLRHPRRVLALGLGLVALAALGIRRLEVNTSLRAWFDPEVPAAAADRVIRERFTGTSTLRVLVEGDTPEALLDPRVVRGMAMLQRALGEDPAITGTLSLADHLKILHRAMSAGDAASYEVPDSRALIAQYLLLLDPDDLSRVLSPDARTAAIYALARADRVAWVEDLFERLRGVAAQHFPPNVHVEVAGGELGQAAAMNAFIVRHKIENVLQVGAVIFALGALVFRSLVVGLIVLAPLACALLVNLGMMGWIGSWLSFATASFTALGVSLGADFTIYLLFRLRAEARSRPFHEAIDAALRTSGRAIFFVALAIGAGNATLFASDFTLWRQLGGYVALMTATSCLATLTIVPALVLLLAPRALGATRREPSAGRAASRTPAPAPGSGAARQATCAATARAGLAGALLLASPLLLGSGAGPGAHTAEQVLATALERFHPDRRERIRIVNHVGVAPGFAQEIEIAVKRSSDGHRLVGTFTSPASVRGVAVLILPRGGAPDAAAGVPPNDYFVYLPALGRARRISGAQRADSFFGTLLSQGDVEPHPAAHYRPLALHDSSLGGEAVFVVEAAPRFEAGYDRIVFTIAQRDSAILKVEAHVDGQEYPLRTIETRREWLQQVDGHALPRRIEVRRGREQGFTEVTFLDRKLDAPIPDSLFSVGHLQRGGRD